MPSRSNQSSEITQCQRLKDIQILLVEDEPDMVDLLVCVLEAEGSTLRTCLDAETALSVLESFQPDILVSNIRLPKQEGTWLIRQIRNHPYPRIRSLPAIGITSYDRETSLQRALDAGFDCFLSKLDSLDALVVAIYRLIR
jgi:CheY-like chemotaxis protein